MRAIPERNPVTARDLLRPSTGRLSPFPDALLDRTEFDHWLGFPSGRAALTYALLDAGVGTNDEVLVPAYTCRAVDVAVRAVSTPRYVDVSTPDCRLDLDHAEELVSERTAAIVPVHPYGLPCHMDAISDFGHRHGLVVVEDAAQALGTTYMSNAVGTGSDYCIFSFRFSKETSVYKGGLLLTHEPPTDADVRSPARLSAFKLGSIATMQALLERLPGRVYQPLREHVVDPLLSSSSASLDPPHPRALSDRQRRSLAGQYHGLGGRVAERRRHAARYGRELPGALTLPPDEGHSYFRYPVLVPSAARDRVCRTLRRRGVGCSPMYRYTLSPPGSCPGADRVASSVLTLPVHAGLDEDDVTAVADLVTRVCQQFDGPEGDRA